MGLLDWLLQPASSAGKNIFTQVTTPPPTSQAARVFSPTPAVTTITQPAAQSQAQTAGSPAVQGEPILKPDSLSMRIFQGAESVAATIRKGIPIVSEKLQAVPVIGKPLAVVTPYTSESVTRLIQTGSMIPGGVEVMVTKPGIIPSMVVSGASQVVTGTIESAQKEPAQFVSDIATTSILGAGAARSINIIKNVRVPKFEEASGIKSLKQIFTKPEPTMKYFNEPTPEYAAAQLKIYNPLESGRILPSTPRAPVITEKLQIFPKSSPEYVQGQFKQFNPLEGGRQLPSTPRAPIIIERAQIFSKTAPEYQLAQFRQFDPLSSGRKIPVSPRAPTITSSEAWWKAPTPEYTKAQFKSLSPLETGRKLPNTVDLSLMTPLKSSKYIPEVVSTKPIISNVLDLSKMESLKSSKFTSEAVVPVEKYTFKSTLELETTPGTKVKYYDIKDASGKTIGTTLVEISGKKAQIGTLELSPEFQGKGIGTNLGKKIISKLKSAGAEEVSLIPKDVKATSFWRKLGFETSPEKPATMELKLKTTSKTTPIKKDFGSELTKKWTERESTLSKEVAKGGAQITKQGQILLTKQKVITKPVEVLDLSKAETLKSSKYVVSEKSKVIQEVKLKPVQLLKVETKPQMSFGQFSKTTAISALIHRQVSKQNALGITLQKQIPVQDTKQVAKQEAAQKSKQIPLLIPKQIPVQDTKQVAKQVAKQASVQESKQITRQREKLKISPLLKTLQITVQKQILKFKSPKKSEQKKVYKGRKGFYGYGEKAAIATAKQLLGMNNEHNKR